MPVLVAVAVNQFLFLAVEANTFQLHAYTALNIMLRSWSIWCIQCCRFAALPRPTLKRTPASGSRVEGVGPHTQKPNQILYEFSSFEGGMVEQVGKEKVGYHGQANTTQHLL